MRTRLNLFGPPASDSGGVVQAWPFERRSQLLAHLALRRGWVGRSELAALLWPDQDTRLAYANLRKTLFRLREWPWAPPVDSQGGALRLPIDTDVARFDEAVAEGRHADALALRQAELLAGFDDDANEPWTVWLQHERLQRRTAWRAAALARLAHRSDPVAAAELSTRLLADDPLDEAALHAHLQALLRAGQPLQARQAHRAFIERLERELGVEPGAALRDLMDTLAASSTASATTASTTACAASTATSTDTPRGAPPMATRASGFVGRSGERRHLAELLARDDTRLLSVAGPGGIGKSRLARQVMAEQAMAFRHGAVFVPLEDASDEASLAARVASAAGVTLAAGHDPLAQLATALSPRHQLLVLDNFEHLAAHAPALERLLDAAPQLRLLVTTRVRLGLAAEQLFPLQGMPYPEREDLDRLEAFDAVQLFVQAARRVEPTFHAGTQPQALAEICHLTDGLPLALEISAGFTRAMSCADIARELRRGTSLMRSTDTARPPRQASLAAVFEQSWRLLAPAERTALLRLAWFRGGFSAEAARQVAGVAPPLLAALVDRSLVRKDGARNALHPLVQQFALERLQGHGGDRDCDLDRERDRDRPRVERDAVALAHARYYLRMPALRAAAIGRADREALRELDAEADNLRLAWRTALGHDRCDDVAAAVPALVEYADQRGRTAEMQAMLDEALQSPAFRNTPRLRAPLQAKAAYLAHRLDRYDAADRLARDALATARAWHDGQTQLQVAKVLAGNALRLGQLAQAQRGYQRVARLARVVGDPRSAAAATSNLALIAKGQDRMDDALALTHRALVLHRDNGNVAAEALCLNNLSVLHLLRQDLAAAHATLHAGAQLCERHGLAATHTLLEINLADLAWRRGDAAATTDHARRALELSAATSQRAEAVTARQHLMRAALARGDLVDARRWLSEAVQEACAIGRPAQKAAGAYLFAEVLAAQGAHDVAARVLSFAMAQPAIVEGDRLAGHTRLRSWGIDAQAVPPWPDLSLDDLVHRIVTETGLAYRPLIDWLRGTPNAVP